jgi:hypothetical protein
VSHTDQAAAGREPRLWRGCAPLGWRRGRQRRAVRSNITPKNSNFSVGPYSSTAWPPARFGDSYAGPQQAGCLRTCRCRLGVEPDRAHVKPSTVRCSCQVTGLRGWGPAASLSVIRPNTFRALWISPPSLWTDTDANGLAKPRTTACRSRHAEDGKHVGANPSPNEGGYSPMTGPEVSRGRLGFKPHAARRRTRVKTCLRSADDHLGATLDQAGASRSVPE